MIPVNILRPRQNGRHFADDRFKCIFFHQNIWISINISLKFVPNGQVNNIPALVQIMACRQQGDKPLSDPMMFNLLTHICVTRPQWINSVFYLLTTWLINWSTDWLIPGWHLPGWIDLLIGPNKAPQSRGTQLSLKFHLRLFLRDPLTKVIIGSTSHYLNQWWPSSLHIDGLVQERRNSSALAMELHLSCTNPSIYVTPGLNA